MTIETKFSRGQKVWAIQHGKAVECQIQRMSIDVFNVEDVEVAAVMLEFVDEAWQGNYEDRPEDQCFATREELIASL